MLWKNDYRYDTRLDCYEMNVGVLFQSKEGDNLPLRTFVDLLIYIELFVDGGKLR